MIYTDRRTKIWITTSFIAWHRWETAPEFCSYLRDFHRHVFHVRVELVIAKDRGTEFINFKEAVDDYINRAFAGQKFEYSCEHIANNLLNFFEADVVEVSEDGENGARVERLMETE